MSIAGEPSDFANSGTTVATPEPAASAPPNYVEQMTQLNELRKSGAISDYDFEKEKFKILERERFGTFSTSGGSAAGQDVVGVGRYVLSFMMVGFIGLGVAYLLRNQGWMAIWVNVVLMFVVAGLLLALSG